MNTGKLTVQLRQDAGKGASRQLRATGAVPGVCYGQGLSSPLPIQVNPKELKAALDPAKKRNTVIDLTVEHKGKTAHELKAMVWEFQTHATKQVITHVDFKAIDPDRFVETEVPIVLVGKPAGAIHGGILSWERRSVDLRCKPKDIPAQLDLDVSSMNVGDSLHVSDIPLPPGVEFHSSPRFGVVSCITPRGVEAPAATDQAAGEVAVEADGKKADGKKADAKKADGKKD